MNRDDTNVTTWPETIYLVAGYDGERAPFDEHAEVTWCADGQSECDVRYVRYDIAEQAKGQAAPVLAAIRDGVPLVEPVSVGKAMMAQRPARVVLDKGTGPLAAVHLVNIGVTGWVHNPETAQAYADGFNRATEWLRSAILGYAAAQPVAEAAAQADDPIRAMQEYAQSVADAYAAAPTAQPTPDGLIYAEAARRADPDGHAQADAELAAVVAAAQPTPPDDEQAAFEADMQAHGFWSELAKGSDGLTYRHQHVRDMWTGWQARAALRQPGALPDGADEFERGYRAGWSASGEGWNAEYGGPEPDSNEFRENIDAARAAAATKAEKGA